MDKEEIKSWRTIYQILKETGYDKLYEDEISCVVNALWKLKKIYKLQQENEFLRKRENKLQMIEQMFKSKSVDLGDLCALVEGE